MPNPVAVFWHSDCARHDAGPGHPESPQRIEAVVERLRNCSTAIEWVEAPRAKRTVVERVHDPDYLDTLQQASAGSGRFLDPDTFVGPDSVAAAYRAAGAALGAAESALAGTPSFAAVRPPGHHALQGRAMGFCLLSNAVIAARDVLERGATRKVLIVDWDVHHGNGTQDLVQTDDRIRYVSTHQHPHYPGTGSATERGVGNLFNVPLPAGLERVQYVAELQRAVALATDGWEPDLLIISAGFDSLEGDPLGGFTFEPEDFADLAAEWSAQWPSAAVLEGGYDPRRTADGVAATIAGLSE